MATSSELPNNAIGTDSQNCADEAPIGLLVTVAAVSALLAACGGGGSASTASTNSGGGAGGTGAAPTTIQAARFLLQAQFSASDTEIAAVQTQGYTAWLAAQINAPASISGWDWQMAQGFNSSSPVNYVNAVYPADYMMWQQLITSSDQVRKRVALAATILPTPSFRTTTSTTANTTRYVRACKYLRPIFCP
jgi:hypothetical protein